MEARQASTMVNYFVIYKTTFFVLDCLFGKEDNLKVYNYVLQ